MVLNDNDDCESSFTTEELLAEEDEVPPYQVGDHVYESNIGLLIQRHGIVTSCQREEDTSEDGGGRWIVTVASVPLQWSSTIERIQTDDHNTICTENRLQVYPGNRLKLVAYRGDGHRLATRQTSFQTDSLDMVLERVRFLLLNQAPLRFRILLRNQSERIAVWCKTGNWSWLSHNFVVPCWIPNAITFGAAAIRVPAAARTLGCFRATRWVPLLFAAPLPVLVVATVPTVVNRVIMGITEYLNSSFETYSAIRE